MLIRADKRYGPRLMNSWLPAETWVEALQKIGNIDAGLTFNVAQFNSAFARSHEFGSAMSRFDGSNNTGIFRVSFQHRHYYYLTQATQQATYPSPLNRSWKERVLEISANNVLIIPSTRARPSTDNSIPVPVNTLSTSKHSWWFQGWCKWGRWGAAITVKASQDRYYYSSANG